jgi:hypothetical protein
MVERMNTDALDRPCIQIQQRTGSRRHLSVEEYEEAQNQANRLSIWATMIYYGVEWALASPRVEQLADRWQEVATVRYRIFDREAYDLQMHQLLGIL